MKKVVMPVFAVAVSLALFADDEATEETTAEAVPVVKTNAAPMKVFTALPLCRRIEGPVSVRKPGGEWERAEEGRFYPFGSSYRAEKGGTLDLSFGPGAIATIADGSEFGTRPQAIGTAARTIVLVRGTISLKLPDNLPEGMFSLTAP